MSIESVAVVAGELASVQAGLVTAGQLARLGALPVEVSRLVRHGVIRRVRQGVYAVAGAPLDPFEHVRAEWLAADPTRTLVERLDDDDQLVAVDETAAAVHGIGDFVSDAVHLNRPTRYRSRRPGLAVTARRLHRKEWQVVDGLPVTTPRRTLEDLVACGRWDESQLVTAVADAVDRGLLPRGEVGRSKVLLALAPHLAEPASAASVLAKVAADARSRGVDPLAAHGEFFRTMFLAVLSERSDEWVVKGGTSMLARFGPVRATRDIDLFSDEGHEASVSASALVRLMDGSRIGDLAFAVRVQGDAVDGGGRSVRLRVDVLGGVRQVGTFSIDVSGVGLLVAPPDERLVPRADTALLPGYPRAVPLRLYPLENQLADKVAALYEDHEGRPSTRYRDLYDIALICSRARDAVDEGRLTTALGLQARRRGLTLPRRLVPPTADWPDAFDRFARTGLPAGELSTYAEASAVAQAVVGPALERLGDTAAD